MGSALVFRAIFAMIADKAGGGAGASHGERVHKGTKIALDYVSKANWHMHAVLYGLIKLLMDDVLGRPAENEQQVRINVLDAPAPERVGYSGLHRHRFLIERRPIMWTAIFTVILGGVGWVIAKLLFEPLKEIADLRHETQGCASGRQARCRR